MGVSPIWVSFHLGDPFSTSIFVGGRVLSLKLTTNAPKNGCLEYFFPFLLGQTAYFQGLCLAVSFRVPGDHFAIRVFPKIMLPPKWMVKIMENPMNKWMIWGVFPPLIFGSTPESFQLSLASPSHRLPQQLEHWIHIFHGHPRQWSSPRRNSVRAKAVLDHRCGRGCTRAGGRQIHVERFWILGRFKSFLDPWGGSGSMEGEKISEEYPLSETNNKAVCTW